MGTMKQWLLEQADCENEGRELRCEDCGEELSKEERECDQPFCFECYCEHQDHEPRDG